MTNHYPQLMLLPLIYGALTLIFVSTNNSLGNVSMPLILLSQFNVVVLSFIIFAKTQRATGFIFLITPIVYCIIFLFTLFYFQSDFREYEASDSYVYDYLAVLLSKPDGFDLALQQNYDISDLGYPYVRYLFSAYAGSNLGLFFFKLGLHYVTSYLVYILAKSFLNIALATKVALFYLNASVLLLFVMSGLKETIFSFLVISAFLALKNSFILGLVAALPTYLFREVYPLLLLASYAFLRNKKLNSGISLVPILIVLIVIYLSFNTNFFTSYFLVFTLFYDPTLLIAAFIGGILGGLVTVDGNDITNFIYSPTVFLLNFLVIQTIVSEGFKFAKNKAFLLILIFATPLIVLGQGLKIRYLAPFYFLYIIFGVRSLDSNKNYSFVISLMLFVVLTVAWNILSN